MSIKKIFTGTFLSLLISLVLVFVLAIIVYFSNISDRTVSSIIFAISCLSVFLGALILARNIASGGLLNGLVLAGIYFAVLLLISILANGTVGVSMGNFLRLLSILASGGLGGVLGINTNKERAMV
ncbi:MAG: TIGR04086 family membrane protein [Clostridia bacterium]|nr:TIGR04086 family membrane protein [Clostridia bacterium]